MLDGSNEPAFLLWPVRLLQWLWLWLLSYFVDLRAWGERVDPIVYGPRGIVDEHRKKTLQLIYNSTDVECLLMLWMTRAPFFALYYLFRQRGLVLDTINSTIEKHVSMFLHVVGHNQRFRVVHQSFRRSIETICLTFTASAHNCQLFWIRQWYLSL